jgi:hypothetical protein
MPAPVDLASVRARIAEPWSPRTRGRPRRRPPSGRAHEGRVHRHSHPGQLFVVPKGAPHQPYSPDGARVFLVEPSATVNTGDTPSELTAERRVV